MDADQLFVETLNELGRRIETGNAEYDVLMAAANLRKLLLDEEPLVDRVNRERRVKVTYRINSRPPLWELAGGPRPDTWSLEDGLDPETALPSAQPEEVKRDALLSKVVMIHRGYEISVRDLISHAANVKGAVHIGEAKTEKEKTVSELATSMAIGGYRAGVRPLQAIGRVALKGLEPLKALIEEEAGLDRR